MIPTWTVLAIPAGLFLATWAAVDGARTLRRRARDRAYAADVARRIRERKAAEAHERAYLDFLEEQFASEESSP